MATLAGLGAGGFAAGAGKELVKQAIPALFSYLFGKSGTETPIQEGQRQLLDELLRSVEGEGNFSDLFNFDENAFQQGIAEPAQQQFEDVIAPMIQQRFISSGQQRSSGLEGALARSGVDLNQMLNQLRYQGQQGAQQNKLSTLNRILSQPAGGMERKSGLFQRLFSNEEAAQSRKGFV